MFDHPSQAEPYLVPFTGELRTLAAEVAKESQQLLKMVPHERHIQVWQEVADSNARYSNLLEGETSNTFIDAHKDAEAALDRVGCVGQSGLAAAVLQEVHRDFYKRVGPTKVVPGAIREVNVRVQRHIPPRWESVPDFLRRTDEVYLQVRRGIEELLILVAVAHHRMLWVHPFQDGNGRSIRLQAQLTLRPLASHFWSLSQGLWCQRERYYEMLAAADSPRLSDLDGRGNLSQARLVEWARFFISVCQSEIQRSMGQF